MRGKQSRGKENTGGEGGGANEFEAMIDSKKKLVCRFINSMNDYKQ